MAAAGVTPAELEVLKRLWGAETATVRELAQAIYSDASPSSYATVQKLLERLERKGFVARLSEPVRPATYRAAVARDELVARQLRATADALCEGSLTPIAAQLVRAGALDADQIRALYALVEGASDEEPPS